MRGVPDPRSGAAGVSRPEAEQREREEAHGSRGVPEALRAIRSQSQLVPRAAVVLGSGLGGVADRIALDPPPGAAPGAETGTSFETSSLPHWPRSTVHGHAGRLVLGWWNQTPVVVLRGRSHRYEGYELDRVTFGVGVMQALGAPILFLTNAVGSMNPEIQPGSLMLVRDHLNFQGTRGLLPAPAVPAEAPFGAGRPTPVYSPRLIGLLQQAALDQKLPLAQGVLMGGLGPAYETASEIRAARRWGADAACMSTVTEALVGASLGMEVAAVSCVTNLGTGLSATPLTHAEVTEVADRVAASLEKLLAEAVQRAVA